MDPHELNGRVVLGVLLQLEGVAPEYIRGVAQWSGRELRIVAAGGQLYPVPPSFSAVAQPVSDGVRAAAPATLRGLLADVEFLVPIPPRGGVDVALAVAPGWHNPPAT